MGSICGNLREVHSTASKLFLSPFDQNIQFIRSTINIGQTDFSVRTQVDRCGHSIGGEKPTFGKDDGVEWPAEGAVENQLSLVEYIPVRVRISFFNSQPQ